MLTITAPIEIKCKTPVTSTHEGFYHRLVDNYSMIMQTITPEDLLHVMTTPPEYYFGEGDQTTIFQQTNKNQFQENRLEVVNNLINRIVVSESAELTYQDRVYITGILQKFGIHNVNEFMHQVSMVKEEHQNTQHLIDLYWNYAGDLRQLVENYKNEQQTQELTQQVQEQKETLHLHEEILNRLQTAAIYQMVQNFNNRPQGDTVITNAELKISDQSRIAQNILLQKLKNEARGERAPIIYRHENYYEEQELTQQQLNEQTLIRQMNSAIMLNLVDNVYQSRMQQLNRSGDEWFHMEQALYQNAENTMQRFENRMDSRYLFSRDVHNDYRAQQNFEDRREIEMLSQLFEDQASQQYQVVNELLQQDFVRQELTNRISEQNEEQYLSELLTEQPKYYTDRSSHIVNSLMDQRKMHQEVTENHLLRQTIEQQNRQNREGDRLEKRTELTQVNVREGDVDAGHQSLVSEQHVEHNDFTAVEEEISRINRENINNQNKYIQMMDGIRESLEQPRGQAAPEVFHQEKTLRLEHPTDAQDVSPSEEPETAENVQPGQKRPDARVVEERHTHQRDLTSVETEISRINRENINNQSKYIQMMDGIRESMERPKEKKTPEQMRRESLMALEHPAELMKQLREEGEKQHAEQAEKLARALAPLPEQTKQVYALVREYLEAPEERRRQMSGISDDIGLLVRDIQAANAQEEQALAQGKGQPGQPLGLMHRDVQILPGQTKEFQETVREFVETPSQNDSQLPGEYPNAYVPEKKSKAEQISGVQTQRVERQTSPDAAGDRKQDSPGQPEQILGQRELVREQIVSPLAHTAERPADADTSKVVSKSPVAEQPQPGEQVPLVYRQEERPEEAAHPDLTALPEQVRELRKTVHEHLEAPDKSQANAPGSSDTAVAASKTPFSAPGQEERPAPAHRQPSADEAAHAQKAAEQQPGHTIEIREKVSEHVELADQRQKQPAADMGDTRTSVQVIREGQPMHVPSEMVHMQQPQTEAEQVQHHAPSEPGQTQEIQRTGEPLSESPERISKRVQEFHSDVEKLARDIHQTKLREEQTELLHRQTKQTEELSETIVSHAPTQLLHREQPGQEAEPAQHVAEQPGQATELQKILHEYAEPLTSEYKRQDGGQEAERIAVQAIRETQLQHVPTEIVHVQQPGEDGTQAQQNVTLLPEQTKVLQETVREYMESPGQVRRQEQVIHRDVEVQAHDIHMTKVRDEQAELLHRHTKQVDELVEAHSQRAAAEIVHRAQEQGADAQAEQRTVVLPEQTKVIHDTVREYMDTPEQIRRQAETVGKDVEIRSRDIRRSEIRESQTQLVHRQQELIKEQTKEVVERWSERGAQTSRQKNVYEDRRTDISLVHRSQERMMDEELIQQMMEQNRQTNRTVKKENETVTNFDSTEHKYKSINTQQVVQQTENVNELVRQGVQRELGVLSEKIYNKLEKRLETERRRRGF